MVVVADSSPLNYLALIDEIQILAELFGRVLIPEAVFRELQSARTPSKAAASISSRPHWLVVQKPPALVEDKAMEKLGRGEREAIALSLPHRPEVLLLIDEGKGRREACGHEISVMGTLGILDMAASRGPIDLPKTIERLIQTNFYVTPILLSRLLERHAQRQAR